MYLACQNYFHDVDRGDVGERPDCPENIQVDDGVHVMGYIEDAIDEVKRATPTTGVNVCIYDDFEDVGDKLETIWKFQHG